MADKRQRIDSASAAVSVMLGAAKGELLPPEHSQIPEGAMPFWRAVVQGRARDEWEAAPALLSTAASLAWTQWQIARLRGMFDGTIETDAGIKEAALATRLLDLQRLEMAYLRTLQQHGRAVHGEARDVSKRRSAAAGIAANSPLTEDDLLARPVLN